MYKSSHADSFSSYVSRLSSCVILQYKLEYCEDIGWTGNTTGDLIHINSISETA
jgi:hypothetical protein